MNWSQKVVIQKMKCQTLKSTWKLSGWTSLWPKRTFK